MIAAAGVSCDALDGDGQIAIAVGDQRRQSVDLARGPGRRLDFDPAADAVEDGVGIETVGGIERVGGFGRRHAAAFRGILTFHSRCAVAHPWTRSSNAGSPVKHISVWPATHGLDGAGPESTHPVVVLGSRL